MSIKNIQKKCVFGLLLGIAFVGSCILDASESGSRQVITRSNSRQLRSTSFLPAENFAQKNKALTLQNQNLATEVDRLKRYTQQFEKEREQLENHLISAVNMIQDERFTNAWLRQQLSDFAAERPRLLEELLEQKKLNRLASDMENFFLDAAFDAMFLSQECDQLKFVGSKLSECKDENAWLSNTLAEKSIELEELKKYISSVKLQGIYLLQCMHNEVQAISLQQTQKNLLIVQRLKEQAAQAAREAQEQFDQQIAKKDNQISDLDKKNDEYLKDARKWFNYSNDLNNKIWQKNVGLCSLSMIIVLLLLDKYYDLQSFVYSA